MATVFAHGELRLYLLALLDSGPKHGYELITELTERFGGTYRPSAGTIYPRLARLEEEGLVQRNEEGRKTTYSLTAAGHAEVEARRADIAALETSIEETVRQRAQELRTDISGSMQGLRQELAAAAQSARTRPRVVDGNVSRNESYALRMEAEALVQSFRNDLRTELRRADAAGTITVLTVDTLRTVLDSAHSAVRETLR